MNWDVIKDYIHAFGWVKGTFTIFFWVSHAIYYRLQNGRLSDRQNEIDRITKENREYRDRFTALLDKHFGLDHQEGKALTQGDNSNSVPESDKEKGGESK